MEAGAAAKALECVTRGYGLKHMVITTVVVPAVRQIGIYGGKRIWLSLPQKSAALFFYHHVFHAATGNRPNGVIGGRYLFPNIDASNGHGFL